MPLPDTGEVASLERGEFAPLFAAAEQSGVPVFCWLPGRAHLLKPYLKQFPRLQFILDHCGVGVAPPHSGQIAPTLASSTTAQLADRRAQFDGVLELAAFDNLALKWSHAPSVLSDEPYPHRDVLPLLRRAIAAFGVERLLWASDYTQARAETGQPWSQALYYLLDSDQLSDDEKEWLLGRSTRETLRWPQADIVALPEVR